MRVATVVPVLTAAADLFPARHRTQQVIQAEAEGLNRYPYRFDTNALTVEVEEGGQLIGPLYHVSGELYAIDIRLDEPLAYDETTVLSYLTLFHYQVPGANYGADS